MNSSVSPSDPECPKLDNPPMKHLTGFDVCGAGCQAPEFLMVAECRWIHISFPSDVNTEEVGSVTDYSNDKSFLSMIQICQWRSCCLQEVVYPCGWDIEEECE